MTGLIRSEMLKIRTTNVWWLLSIGVALFTAIALTANCIFAHIQLTSPDRPGGNASVPDLAANIYTSGQTVGLLLAMIMGILIVTNEFHHQTATPTFLTTPVRSRVIGAKVVTAVSWGMLFAALSTVLSLITGAVFLTSAHVSTELGNGDVIKPVLLNILAYGIWAVFGVGIGTLIRNQIASIIVALVLYIVVDLSVHAALFSLAGYLHHDWIAELYYYLPSGASSAMTSSGGLEYSPMWWAGALTLAGYGIVAGLVGTAVTSRRDIG
ncbi:MAG: type transport system permease protein [Cryptosporangiaceae bacterium]|nr:type transport system permease protein [Cryptosporangiaceae bacterium]